MINTTKLRELSKVYGDRGSEIPVDPQTILTLLDRLERYETVLKFCSEQTMSMHINAECMAHQMKLAAEAALREGEK